jgi:formyl-CoA transferase
MTENDPERDAFYAEARTDTSGPLTGFRVLEVATTIAGPRCGLVFADYGADVIHVELPTKPDVMRVLPPFIPDTNPPESCQYTTFNRGKRAMTLDVRRPEGLRIFMQLAARSDVVVENFKKGTMASWGCGYEDVRKVKPDIVYVSVTGYGQYGPLSDLPGYDPSAQSHAGFAYMNRMSTEDLPMRAPVYLADEFAGLHGALGAMAALLNRNRTGEGQHIDVSLLDALIDSSTGLHTQAAAGLPTPHWGNRIPHAAPAGLFACKDGYVFAGILLDAHWPILAKVIGRMDLVEDARFTELRSRLKHREEVDAVLAEWCAPRTRDEIIRIFADSGITASPALTPAEAVADPHIQARECLQTVRHACGKEFAVTGPAPKFSRTPARVRSCAPALGANTDAILQELGLSADDCAALRKQGVI